MTARTHGKAGSLSAVILALAVKQGQFSHFSDRSTCDIVPCLEEILLCVRFAHFLAYIQWTYSYFTLGRLHLLCFQNRDNAESRVRTITKYISDIEDLNIDNISVYITRNTYATFSVVVKQVVKQLSNRRNQFFYF